MQTKKSTKSAPQSKETKGNFRFTDFIIIVFFLFIASSGIALFRQDLLQTFGKQNKEPAGIVIIKKNIVQRRLVDRVLWDRLANESPVYLGDLIHVADISSAVLDIENNSIDLDENTLIRITHSPDGEGFKIELTSGKMSVSSGVAGKGISLELNGQHIKTSPGTVLSAAAGEKGTSVQVSSGKARIAKTEGGGENALLGAASRGMPGRDTLWREVSSGERVAIDSEGKEINEKAAVVTRPVPNARYLKNASESVSVSFEWNRINFLPEEKLQLEIAQDGNFSRILRSVNGLDKRTNVSLDTGIWYWRLSFKDGVLNAGRIYITDGSGPQLISPAVNSHIRYQNEPPVLNFQWRSEEDAVSYIMEVSKTPDFSSTQIRAQIPTANYSDSSLEPGTWYWRVMPVFPAVYDGNASFSQPAFFRIEQNTAEQAAPEQGSLDKYLASVTPSRTELPSDVPKEIAVPAVKPEPKLEKKVEYKKPDLRLVLPKQKTKLDGLDAMRQQTVFTWECSGKVVRSRFVLSRNSNPLQGRAVVEIQNPGHTIRLDNLGEGIWYWNVEARTADGFTVSAPAAYQIQVLPVPPLPPPENVSPRAGYRYGLDELRTLKNIVFEWKTVKGANSYIFALYQQTENGRRQIVGLTQSSGTTYKLNNLKVLENGTFFWQVEAVSLGRNGAVERQGKIGEYTFVLDFPPPEPVEIEDTVIFYGN